MKSRELKFVYGPVPSRRLGRSLGVNPIPLKTCNYSCIYCQLGRTQHLINERKEFFSKEDILEEILYSVELNRGKIDFITFVGEGEPTLNKNLGWLIVETKKTELPIAVITNGALLYREDVREDLSKADVVLPSLDSVSENTFKILNRPHKDLKIEKIIEGMVEFRRSFEGQIWLEIILVKGINDSEKELEGLSRVLREIKPDRVYINVPIRPPTEPWVEPPDEEAIVRAHAILGDVIPIVNQEMGEFGIEGFDNPVEAIKFICRRHPMREDEIIETLKRNFDGVDSGFIMKLVKEGILRKITYRGTNFYITPEVRMVRKQNFTNSN